MKDIEISIQETKEYMQYFNSSIEKTYNENDKLITENKRFVSEIEMLNFEKEKLISENKIFISENEKLITEIKRLISENQEYEKSAQFFYEKNKKFEIDLNSVK